MCACRLQSHLTRPVMHFSLFFKKKNWFVQTKGKRVRMTSHIAVDCEGHEQRKSRCGGKIGSGTKQAVSFAHANGGGKYRAWRACSREFQRRWSAKYRPENAQMRERAKNEIT